MGMKNLKHVWRWLIVRFGIGMSRGCIGQEISKHSRWIPYVMTIMDGIIAWCGIIGRIKWLKLQWIGLSISEWWKWIASGIDGAKLRNMKYLEPVIGDNVSLLVCEFAQARCGRFERTDHRLSRCHVSWGYDFIRESVSLFAKNSFWSNSRQPGGCEYFERISYLPVRYFAYEDNHFLSLYIMGYMTGSASLS